MTDFNNTSQGKGAAERCCEASWEARKSQEMVRAQARQIPSPSQTSAAANHRE